MVPMKVMAAERGVSSVLGIVLILGITLAALTTVMILGGMALQTSQADSQLSQMETSMAEMSSKASLSALGDAQTQRFDLGDTRDGQLEVRPDAGNVSISYELNTSEGHETGMILEQADLGALVYVKDDEEIAYQGGGVWRATGENGGHMISPPEYHYQSETLTFPIIRIAGDGSAHGQATGTIERTDPATIFPNSSRNANFTNPVEDMKVFVEIESDYHRGWYTFFDSRSDGVIEYDPDNQTVRKELTVPFDETFDDAVATTGNIRGTGSISGDYSEGQSRPSASELIEDKIGAHEGKTTIDGGGSYNNSVYFADDLQFSDGDSVTFDTSENDIEVMVNGTLEIEDDVNIDGDGNVRFYVREGLEMGGGDKPIVNNRSATQLAIFVHSNVEEIDDAANFNGEFYGLIYAPGSHLDWKGNNEFTGAMVLGSADFGGAIDVAYDPAFETFELDIPTTRDILRYLHITDNQISVEID